VIGAETRKPGAAGSITFAMSFSRIPIRFGVVALIASFTVSTLAIVPFPASAADRGAVERGRSAGRAILLLRSPAVCGIVVLRARCMADVDTFLGARGDADFKDVPKIGPHPATGLRAYVTNGDRDGFDRALYWINSTTSPEPMWKTDPSGAAAYDAGIGDVFFPAAVGNMAAEYLSIGPVIDITHHLALIPPGALPVDVAPLRTAGVSSKNAQLPPGAIAFTKALVQALDVAVPGEPLATFSYPPGPAGDAMLGIAYSTVNELTDSAEWASQPDAQRFFDDYFARLRAIAPGRASEIFAVREKLRGGAGFRGGDAVTASSQLFNGVLQASPVRQRMLLGAFAAQMPYNAAVFRDADNAGMFLRILGSLDALDSIPGLSKARAEANTIAPTDWLKQYALGVRLVDLIMKGGSR
jgi:hypothetical protein